MPMAMETSIEPGRLARQAKGDREDHCPYQCKEDQNDDRKIEFPLDFDWMPVEHGPFSFESWCDAAQSLLRTAGP